MVKQTKAVIDLDDRIQRILLWGLRLFVFLIALAGLLLRDWNQFFISVGALLLMFSNVVIEKRYKVKLPIEFELIIATFIFAGFVLGEVGDAYERFWWWDVVLHTTSGLMLSFAGFLVLYVMYNQGRLAVPPILIAFFAFCAGVAIGALWEIFEFMMDGFFGLNMQKSGLDDTMWDLIVDSVGALAVAIAGYYYIKGEREGLVARFITNFLNANPQMKGNNGKKDEA